MGTDSLVKGVLWSISLGNTEYGYRVTYILTCKQLEKVESSGGEGEKKNLFHLFLT